MRLKIGDTFPLTLFVLCTSLESSARGGQALCTMYLTPSSTVFTLIARIHAVLCRAVCYQRIKRATAHLCPMLFYVALFATSAKKA